MSCRILQNNHLFRRIEHKNIFKTFSKTYKRCSLTPQLHERSKFNNTLEQTSKMSTLAVDRPIQSRSNALPNDRSVINSERYELETSVPLHIHQKYSIKLFPSSVECHSKTSPVELQLQKMSRQRKFSRECMTTLGSKTPTSDNVLFKWNERRKKEEFKLKACFDKDRATYDAPYDETDFSTLEAKKREEILTRKEDRYHQRRHEVIKENNNLSSLSEMSIGNTKRGAFILTKYSRFINEGIKSNMHFLNKAKK